jgi:hypothetical protein
VDRALAALAEYESSNESAWDSECGGPRADEAVRVLYRIATAGGIELPSVPDWLKEARPCFRPTFEDKAWSTFDQRQAVAEGWCLMVCDGPGVIEIQRDDEANTFSRPALGLRVFKYNEEAREYVAKRAAEGSPHHQQALAIVEGQLA